MNDRRIQRPPRTAEARIGEMLEYQGLFVFQDSHNPHTTSGLSADAAWNGVGDRIDNFVVTPETGNVGFSGCVH